MAKRKVKPKTVRIRIAVAVDSAGEWVADGWSLDGSSKPAGDEAMRDEVLSRHLENPPVRIVFVEADVPLPGGEVIQGRVEE